MKVLLIGNGGRENALARSIFNSPSFKKSKSKMYCTIGSPGIDKYAEPIDIKASDVSALLKFAEEEKIDFTVVGPEVPLAEGVVDEFQKKGLKIFGPTKNAARIESSKKYAKELMQANGIPTAKFKVFGKEDLDSAKEYLNSINYPIVIKADGLAAGKGVIIAGSKQEAEDTLNSFVNEEIFGESGFTFVIEEFIEGNEVSVFAITDGEDYIILPSSQDHKKIGEGEKGKNTGGMGAYSPAAKFLDDELLMEVKELIIDKTLYALSKDKSKFKGCLYAGLMIDSKRKPYVIEFNCRFGDPETQAVLPLIKSDFLELLMASAEGNIKDYKLETYNETCACVVLASDGYPDEYEKGIEVKGLENVDDDCIVFHAGTKHGDNGEVLTNGGRVFNVVCKGKTLKDALDKVYSNIDRIEFDNKYFRKDIGFKSL